MSGVPFAMKKNQQLYRFLVLLDILYSGRKRKINFAEYILKN